MFIKLVAPSEVPPRHQSFSPEDWILLDAMGSAPLPACTGRFLTMHKRRRKKLITRSLLQDHAILDDILHGQVQHILDKVNLWSFNAFTLETVAGGRSLPVLCVHLFHWYGLFEHFELEVVHVWKLFTLIEEGYHNTNPYHNSIHATDVTQAMHCFLQEAKVKEHLQPIEIMAALIGAVAHDLDHPGVNQNFLIQTQNHLAVLYDNMSVLENHHWRSAIGCLLESGVLDQLIPYKEELEEQIRELILATDINRQQEFLTKFKKHLDEDTLDLTVKENRRFILQIALKCADISNPTRPWEISKKWSLKVCDEFFRQGEYERQLNLPVTVTCDRQSTTIAKIQTGFSEYVVAPLFSEWHRFLASALSSHMMELLDANWNRWKAQKESEMAQETQTELSDTEPADVDVSIATRSSSKQKFSLDIPSVTDFIQPSQASQTGYRRQSLAVPTLESQPGVRRHSVPVHVELQLPRTIYRRESLPQAPNNYLHHHRHSSSGRSTVSPVFSGDSRASSAGHLREEDELELAFGSQTSLLSSGSDRQYSTEDQVERPLSAENLLPEPNIASMTSSNGAAAKLSSVLHGSAPPNKALTRQQTFPPPQPYVRMRYMSATVEMTTCPESAQEGASDSSVNSSREHISSTSVAAVCVTQHSVIPSIAVLSPNNDKSPDSQVPELTLSPTSSSSSVPLLSKTSFSTSSYKREQQENVFEKEKASKLPKLTDTELKQGKENLDPRLSSSSMLRRGSAPVPFVPLNESDPAGRVMRLPDTHTLRRGSVPTEAVRLSIQKERSDITCPSSSTVEPFPRYQPQRRGSAPTDLPPPSSLVSGYSGGNGGTSSGGGVTCMLTRHVSLNGKACGGRRSKKHQLHRRSSGGPETVCLGGNGSEGGTSGESSCSRVMFLRQPDNNADVLLARRRGSLPIEVLTVGHSVC